MSSNSMDSFRKLHAVPFDYIGRMVSFCRAVNERFGGERLKIKWYEIIAKNIAMEYSI